MNNAPDKVVVSTKSDWKGKINWTQIIGMLATILVIFGIDIPVETQVAMVAGIQGIQSALTFVWKKWFTNTISASSVTADVVIETRRAGVVS